MITPINNYIIVKVDNPEDKIGSIYIPEVAQKKLCKGTVVSVSEKLRRKVMIDERVWYMEDQNPFTKGALQINSEHCLVDYSMLNATELLGLGAFGSKILVRIDKQKQKENKFFKETKILLTEFNNDYSFNNQFGEVVSVGCDVEEKIQIGDVAFFNQFIEGTVDKPNLSTLIKTLPNGDEIRVVQTGTSMDYELFGYMRGGEFMSSKHYVFVEQNEQAGLKENETGLLIQTDPNKNKSLTQYTVAHKSHDGLFNPGDTILARQGASNSISKHINVRFVHEILVEAIL